MSNMSFKCDKNLEYFEEFHSFSMVISNVGGKTELQTLRKGPHNVHKNVNQTKYPLEIAQNV